MFRINLSEDISWAWLCLTNAAKLFFVKKCEAGFYVIFLGRNCTVQYLCTVWYLVQYIHIKIIYHPKHKRKPSSRGTGLLVLTGFMMNHVIEWKSGRNEKEKKRNMWWWVPLGTGHRSRLVLQKWSMDTDNVYDEFVDKLEREREKVLWCILILYCMDIFCSYILKHCFDYDIVDMIFC